jgi:predicted amidohydrolase
MERTTSMARPLKVRIAAAQYPVQKLGTWTDFCRKLQSWVAAAVRNKAQILVFPEFGAMELASIFEKPPIGRRRSSAHHTLGSSPITAVERRERPILQRAVNVVQPLLPDYRTLHAELADRYGVYILASSLPVRGRDGVLRNTAYFFAPDGTMGTQEKIVLTRRERDCWGITSGNQVRYFDTRFGPIGIAICYDIEFPLIARSQAEAKVQIILSPSCTGSLRGYYRVRVGARARALENQAYVVQSATIGKTPWSAAGDMIIGAAGVYAPPDIGPREDGIIIQGAINKPRWIYADLDLAAIGQLRPHDRLTNQEDWMWHLGVGRAVAGKFHKIV